MKQAAHIENNTWACIDMEYLLECSTQQLTSEGSKQARCRNEHKKRNSISTSSHVLFYFSYKLNNSPLLSRKVNFINK